MNVLLIATSEYLCLYAIQCLHGPGVNIRVLGLDGYSLARFSRHCSGYLGCTLDEIEHYDEALIGRINAYCFKNKIDVVLPCGMKATFFVSETKRKIKQANVFPVPDAKTLRELDNKWTFMNLLDRIHLPHPESVLINDVSDLKDLKINFPIILKPLAMHGRFWSY